MLSKEIVIAKCLQIDSELDRLGYTASSRRTKMKSVKAFISYVKNKPDKDLEDSVFQDFLVFREKIKTDKAFIKERGEVKQIANWVLHGQLKVEPDIIRKREQIKDTHLQLLERYIIYLRENGNNEGGIIKSVNSISIFLIWSGDNKIDILKLSKQDIATFIDSKYKEKAPYTLSGDISCIRRFYRWLYLDGIINTQIDVLFPKIGNLKVVHPQKLWSKEEISGLLRVININTTKGKRDYAIILLAAQLGMRSSDIENLKFENINWEERKIVFTQQKTGVHNELYLTKEAGWAIIKYIECRPKLNLDDGYIFRKMKPPFHRIKNTAGSMMSNYCRLAGIEYGKGSTSRSLHSLRHTLATVMLESGIPLHTISGVLGHASIESAESYLDYDIKHLSECCLDLNEVFNDIV